MSRKTALLTRNELTNATLQEIFRHAQIEANMAADNLLLTIDGLRLNARSVADRGYIFLSSSFTPKPGTASRQVLELSNRINEGLAFITAYFSEGFFKLVVGDYIDTNAGVSAEEVVDETRRFRAAIRAAMAMDTEHILEATLRSYAQRCLEPGFAEGEESRDWRSDPSFRSVLDPLNAGDLTTAAQQAEKLAVQFPDLDLPYDWWAGALLRQRKLDEARKVSRRGLEQSKRKYMLCARLGEVNREAGLLADAVYWWAQAVHCQESLRHRTGEYKSYLYLHYVAAGANEPEVAAAFLQKADSIAAGMIRLDPATARSLTDFASRHTTPDIREVLTGLRARYLQTQDAMGAPHPDGGPRPGPAGVPAEPKVRDAGQITRRLQAIDQELATLRNQMQAAFHARSDVPGGNILIASAEEKLGLRTSHPAGTPTLGKIDALQTERQSLEAELAQIQDSRAGPPTPASSLDSSLAALTGEDHEARKAAITWLAARGYQDQDEPRTLQDLPDPMNSGQEALARDLREHPDFDVAYLRAAYPTMHAEDHAHANAAILRDGVLRCRRKGYLLARLCSYRTWQEDWIAALDYAVAAVVIGDPSQGPGDMVQVMELLSLTFKRTASTECPRWEELVSDAVAADRAKAPYVLGEAENTAVQTAARQLAGQHPGEVIWAADTVRKKLSGRKTQGA